MMITIREEGLCFNARVGAIIYNEDKTKILLENQKNKRYVFPGGRINFNEESGNAIARELKEEMNLEADFELKYIVETLEDFSEKRYHEIGFYHVTTIKESEVKNNFKSLDYDGIFEWIPVSELEKYNTLIKPLKDKILKNEIVGDTLEHIIYKGC